MAGWGAGHCETGAGDETFRWQTPSGFSHQYDGCQAQDKGSVDVSGIAGLVMGAFMPVDKALKFRRRGGVGLRATQ